MTYKTTHKWIMIIIGSISAFLCCYAFLLYLIVKPAYDYLETIKLANNYSILFVKFWILIFVMFFIMLFIYYAAFFSKYDYYIVFRDDKLKKNDYNLEGLRLLFHQNDFHLSSIICKHCFKSIVFKDITFTCPYCDTVFPNNNDNCRMDYVLFYKCPHCGRIIRYFNCPHPQCNKEIDIFEHYDQAYLMNKEFSRK